MTGLMIIHAARTSRPWGGCCSLPVWKITTIFIDIVLMIHPKLLVCLLQIRCSSSSTLSSLLTPSLPSAGTAVTPKSCTSWARWSRGVTPTTLRAARSEVTRCPPTSGSCTPTTCSCGGSCTPSRCCLCCSGPTGTLPSAAAAWRRART